MSAVEKAAEKLRAEFLDARNRSRLSRPVARPLTNGLTKKKNHWKNEHNRKSLCKYQDGEVSLMELVGIERKPLAKGSGMNTWALACSSRRQVMHGWWTIQK